MTGVPPGTMQKMINSNHRHCHIIFPVINVWVGIQKVHDNTGVVEQVWHNGRWLVYVIGLRSANDHLALQFMR